MMKVKMILIAFAIFAMIGCNTDVATETEVAPEIEESAISIVDNAVATYEPFENETHFGTLYQITDGGENAEAYFNSAGDKLSFQRPTADSACDQIHTMNIDGTNVQLLSVEGGRTTCSFIGGDDEYLIYASTYEQPVPCEDIPSRGRDYSWILFDYDIYKRNLDGSGLVNLTNSPGYDAEAIAHPNGEEIIFSSTRTGDQEIYLMKPDGSDVRQLTDTVGYDGGPFYNWDGTKVVYRSYHPKTDEELAVYNKAISENKMARVPLEIFIMNADGSEQTQLTEFGKASFAPFMHPDNKRIIFCSNYGASPREFNLWMINADGSGLEQITHSGLFDGFPMFSKDGKYLMFISNRHAAEENHQNIFITEWID
jgi:TolB protein